MSELTPYLAVHDARAAIAWYVEYLGAEVTVEAIVMPDGRVGHVELDGRRGRWMMADEHPRDPGGGAEAGRGAAVDAAPDGRTSRPRRSSGRRALDRGRARAVGRIAVLRDPFGPLAAASRSGWCPRTDGAARSPSREPRSGDRRGGFPHVRQADPAAGASRPDYPRRRGREQPLALVDQPLPQRRAALGERRAARRRTPACPRASRSGPASSSRGRAKVVRRGAHVEHPDVPGQLEAVGDQLGGDQRA